jgi:hypothetical protein
MGRWLLVLRRVLGAAYPASVFGPPPPSVKVRAWSGLLGWLFPVRRTDRPAPQARRPDRKRGNGAASRRQHGAGLPQFHRAPRAAPHRRA